ncbi:MAG: glycosyltransferase [Cyanobacteria bacterium J06560_2]
MLNQFVGSPLVSIIIPVFNGGESFRKCLESLNKWAIGAEVVVVADGESDGSWKTATDLGAEVIRLPASKGPANARNVGAKAASSSILLFIDADVTIHPTTVVQVYEAFQSDADMAALIGSYDDAPGAPNFLSQYKNLFHHYTHQQASEEASSFWGACGAVRKSAFLQVGGFDARYRRPCIEDIELGYRLRQAGYKIRLCKNIQIKHLKHWTSFSLLRAEMFYRALPWMALLLKLKQTHPAQYRQVSGDLNLEWKSRLSVVLIYAMCAGILLSTVWPVMLWAVMVGAIALFLLNLPVYRFFYRKRGVLFAMRVLPWHWLYYFYSGLAFVIGTVRHQLGMWRVGSGRKTVVN